MAESARIDERSLYSVLKPDDLPKCEFVWIAERGYPPKRRKRKAVESELRWRAKSPFYAKSYRAFATEREALEFECARRQREVDVAQKAVKKAQMALGQWKRRLAICAPDLIVYDGGAK